MKFSFSHIAWQPADEGTAMELLQSLGINEIEVAPVRAFGPPLAATEFAVRQRADWYRERGFKIGSFQALLFGSEGHELFGSGDSVQRLKSVLIALGRIAGWAGAGPMVFGAPKNRLRGDLSHAAAIRQASEFFREVGDACAEAGSCLVIEANPEAYGADFCTRLEQAAELVIATRSAGFGLHIDAGGMALSGECFEPILREASGLIRHVHASQPNLVSFTSPHPVLARVAELLHEIDYSGSISIEMRAQDDGLDSVKEAIKVVRSIYGQTR